MPTKNKTAYFRNFIFGVEDSLVSTVGLLSGIHAAGLALKSIVLTGVVLVFVEAFSMAVGSLVSENSAEEFTEKQIVPLKASLGDAGVMFVSYLVSGLIVVCPYIFLSSSAAFSVSIILSLVLLFVLGGISGYLSKTSIARQGSLMVFLGGTAILLGVVVGRLVEGLR